MQSLDLERMYPGIFEGISPHEAWAIQQAFAAAWHEGWEPNREAIADAVSLHKGEITMDEHTRRALARAREMNAARTNV